MILVVAVVAVIQLEEVALQLCEAQRSCLQLSEFSC